MQRNREKSMVHLPPPTRRLERRLPVKGRERCPGCHPERSEGSLRPSSQTLRGVYPERSEWAQGDRHSLQMSIASASEMQQVAWTLSGLLAAAAGDFSTGFRCRDRHLDIVVLLYLVDDG